MSPLDALLRRIEARTAVVAVVGLGHVGLPVAEAALGAGFAVLGVDVDAERLAQVRQREGLRLTGDGAALGEADALLICVPTPLDARREPDLGPVVAATRMAAASLRSGQLVVLESTTWPGTTREVLLPLLSGRGLVCGEHFFLAYSPERMDPGRAEPAMADIPRLVGGVDAASGRAAVALYAALVRRVVPVSSAEVAEAAKLLENVYRAVNIALVNEMKVLLTPLGVDVHEVVAAAASKPFGFQSFRPGPGWGGHCIPIDPFYLAWRARQAGVPARLIEAAGAVNTEMPAFVLARLEGALERPLAGARVLLVGAAYKADIDDVRESPSQELLVLLLRRGALVDYHDPHVPAWQGRRSAPLDPAAYDAVVVATDHRAVDWDLVAREARLAVDTRGVLRGRGGRVVDA